MNGDGDEIWLKGEVEEWKNQGIIDDYKLPVRSVRINQQN